MKQTFIVLALLCTTITSVLSQNSQDCLTAKEICEQGTYHVSNMNGRGQIKENLQKSECSSDVIETNSSWFKWKIQEAGIVTFTVDPTITTDDLDFILYKVSNNCENLQEVRCMLSGRSHTSNNSTSSRCEGQTGLSLTSIDEFELSGCKYNDDNYLKFLETEIGEEYVLLVNNYNSGSGFSMTLQSTGKLTPYAHCNTDKNKTTLRITDIYPNPASENINIKTLNSSKSEISLQLLRIDGSIVKSKTLKKPNNLIPLSVNNLPSGTYIVRITQDEITSSRRFIKQ